MRILSFLKMVRVITKPLMKRLRRHQRGSKTRFIIYVKRGTYNEIVHIGKLKTNVTIVGDGSDATIITGSLNFKDGTKTFDSATVGT